MTRRPRVVTFSTYAPSPRYGGPARLHWLRVVLSEGGFDTCSVVVNTVPEATQIGPEDLRVRPVAGPELVHDPLFEDVLVGQRAATQPQIVSAVRFYLDNHRPDIIWLEQPWLLPLVELAVGPSSRVQLVYSSQNVEHKLKRVLQDIHSPGPLTDRTLVRTVREVEAAAIGAAAVVFSICEADRKELRSEFGKDSIVLPNGSSIGASSPDPGSRFASLFNESGRRLFGFAASSYLPNLAGLSLVATPSLAFLPPTARIALAGSISDAAHQYLPIVRHYSLNVHRLVRFGFLNPVDFTQFSLHVPCTIVPIFHGGGSNLKTADALASGTEVIASTESLVGYEDVMAEDPTGVTVVDGAAAFREAMLDVLSRRPRARMTTRRSRDLSWTSRLSIAGATLSSM